MENPEFEWDDEKAISNLKKHVVSFEEGATIFNEGWTSPDLLRLGAKKA